MRGPGLLLRAARTAAWAVFSWMFIRLAVAAALTAIWFAWHGQLAGIAFAPVVAAFTLMGWYAVRQTAAGFGVDWS